MPRNISFAMTPEQITVRTKFVTRRFGWWFLKKGDVLRAVHKSMGLKAGEKVEPILDIDGNPTLIEVVSTRPEPLNDITGRDVELEGFPWMTPKQFARMVADHYNCDPKEICNRIEFRYLENHNP